MYQILLLDILDFEYFKYFFILNSRYSKYFFNAPGKKDGVYHVACGGDWYYLMFRIFF